MDKKEALKKLANLEEETAKLRKIIEEPENYIDSIDSYKQVCKKLGEKELTLNDFNFLPEHQRVKNLTFAKIQQVANLFNGDWKVNILDNNQKKWYPYYDLLSGGLVFYSSACVCSGCVGPVVYYKDEQTSNYVGKLPFMINLYKELYS